MSQATDIRIDSIGGALERAIFIAVEAHHGQKDKAEKPYILHPLKVMLRMTSETEMIAAVLHDVIEDTRWTLDDLRKEGFPAEVVSLVECLTRKEKERYKKYIGRILLNPSARKVKLADLEDNLDIRRIGEPTGKDWKRLKKYHQVWLTLSSENDQ